MSEFYNLDGIIAELKKELEKHIEFLAVWEKVTFPTKKDGTPFANMQKNIDGAKIGNTAMCQPGEYNLTVNAYTNTSGYVHDTIDIYNLVKYLKDPAQIAKTQNYMPKQSYLEQVYAYDMDDIKQAVTARIEYMTKRVESLKAQIAKAENAYAAFKAAYATALDELQTNCDTQDVGYSNGKNDLYYAVKDTIVNRYPYC